LFVAGVEVHNNISMATVSMDIRAEYPSPRDLEVILLHDTGNLDLDTPTCIPEVNDRPNNDLGSKGQILSVFSRSPFKFEASVARGNNLTFTFMIGLDEPRVITPDDASQVGLLVRYFVKQNCIGLKLLVKLQVIIVLYQAHLQYIHIC